MPAPAEEIKTEPATETVDITGDADDNKIDLEASLAGLTDSNFTDMEFAPPGEPAAFDMASFAPADNATDLLSLENLMPVADASKAEPTTAGDGAVATSLDAEFADLFDNNDGQADGMDFDFSIGGGGGSGGGGGGDDTFDDLMNTRGEDSFGMGGDDFDASFFGLDKPEGT